MPERSIASSSDGVQPPSEAAGKKAREYQKHRHLSFLVSLSIQLFGLLFSFFTGWTFLFKQWAVNIHAHPFSVVSFYFLFFSIYFLILEFPFEVYSSYWVEKKYGLSTQTLRAWLRDEGKKEGLTFVFFLVLIELLYFFLRAFPKTWWLFAWGGWLIVTLLLGKFAHVLILPLFYKCVRLTDEKLRARILSLLEKNHFPAKEVYVVNLSKTTRKANAAFAGLGSTRRVLLADTLLETFTQDEIETVVAHELGHAKRHHLAKNLLWNTAVSLAVFYAAFLALSCWARPLGFEGPHDIAGFPILGLVGFLAGLILLPVSNLYSRFHEREADDFAIQESSSRESFISALRKLGALNLAELDPHPLIEFFLYSHPSLGKRIRRAQTS